MVPRRGVQYDGRCDGEPQGLPGDRSAHCDSSLTGRHESLYLENGREARELDRDRCYTPSEWEDRVILEEIGALRPTRDGDGPLTIALLTVGYPPENTHGVARSTHTLARGLVELGHEVHVITAGSGEGVRLVDGASVHEVAPTKSSRYRSFAARGYPNLAAWLNYSHASFEKVRQLRADRGLEIVDSPLWNLDGIVTSVSGVLPVVVRVVTAMKQIADVHGRQSPETEVLGELEGELLRHASGIISNSGASAEALTRVYGLQPEDYVHDVIPYGMVPAPDADLPETRTDQTDQLTVLFVGRLEKRKGIQDLFAAIPEVVERFPSARFIIAGSDNSVEDGFAEETA